MHSTRSQRHIYSRYYVAIALLCILHLLFTPVEFALAAERAQTVVEESEPSSETADSLGLGTEPIVNENQMGDKTCDLIGIPFIRSPDPKCLRAYPIWQWQGLFAAMSSNSNNPASSVQGKVDIARTGHSNYQSISLEYNRQSRLIEVAPTGLPEGASLENVTAQSTDGRSAANLVIGYLRNMFDVGFEIGLVSDRDRGVSAHERAHLFYGFERRFETNDAVRFEIGLGQRYLSNVHGGGSSSDSYAFLSTNYSVRLGKSTDFRVEFEIEQGRKRYFSALTTELSFWISNSMALSLSNRTFDYDGFGNDVAGILDGSATITTLGLLVRR